MNGAKGNRWLRLRMLKRHHSIEMTWYNNSNSPLKDRMPLQPITMLMISTCQLSLTIQGSCVSLMQSGTLFHK